jgi:transcriptional regulator GlxA family with amidase domain
MSDSSSPPNCYGSRRIVMLAFEGGQTLDVTGPLEVFAMANRELAAVRGESAARDEPDTRPEAYRCEVVALEAGPVRMSSGLEIVAARSIDDCAASLKGLDTLMVSGGEGTLQAMREPRHISFLRELAPSARRVASVCSGSFLLAEAGLLDGRRATTHWRNTAQLAESYPAVEVDPDPIYIEDDGVFTSAGVTSGMDLALALVEADHGRSLALEVARALVLFLKRPGGQSQFSSQLASQLAERENVREVQDYIADHLDADLGVAALARMSAMSPRNFARVFRAEVGATPARFVERSRVEAARRRLEETRGGIDLIAAVCGFGSSETMRRAFLRNLQVGPSEYRDRFRSAATVR